MKINIPQVKQSGFNTRGSNPRDLKYTKTQAYQNTITSDTMDIPKNKR